MPTQGSAQCETTKATRINYSQCYTLPANHTFATSTTLVFRQLPEPELAIAEPVLADLSACRAELSAFINRAKLGQAEPMEMPLWEGSGSGSSSSWPELSLAPGTMSAAWGALQITRPPIAANFPLRYHN